jgi:hypothetical protein
MHHSTINSRLCGSSFLANTNKALAPYDWACFNISPDGINCLTAYLIAFEFIVFRLLMFVSRPAS